MVQPAPRNARPAPAVRIPRVTLSSVSRQPNRAPLRVLLYGVEGVGKTTFAAGAPNPIFIGPEDGIPRALGEVPHFPVPEGGWSWLDVVDAVRALAQDGHEYQTLVVDTLDWLEPLVLRHVVDTAGVSSIEDVGGGFGKGYVAAVDCWRALIAELEILRRTRRMAIVLLAHSNVRQFKNPTGEDYDRYELKLNAKAAGLWREWPDAVIFACHDDVASKDARTKRVRGVSSGARVIRTVHHAAYDAKNRFGLPEELPLAWADFSAAVESGPADRAQELRESIALQLPHLKAEERQKAEAALERAGGDAAKLEQLDNWCAAKAQEGGAQ